jgi:hypothetical protein
MKQQREERGKRSSTTNAAHVPWESDPRSKIGIVKSGGALHGVAGGEMVAPRGEPIPTKGWELPRPSPANRGALRPSSTATGE